jgi:hypothetical protein
LCDLTKAFDYNKHTVFLNNLHYRGIKGSYNENRKQQVSTSPHILDKENSSTWEMLTSGVPQSSKPGRLLFIMYLNDFLRGLHKGAKPVTYANDTTIWLTARNVEGLKTKINGALDYMIGWF